MTVWFDKARKSWRYDFRLAGVRYAKECTDASGNPVTSRRAAQGCENAARAAAKMAPKLPRATDLRLAQIINDLSEGWMREADWPNKRRYAREIVAFFGTDKPIAAIDGAAIQDYINFALKQPIKVWHGAGRKPTGEESEEALWKPASSGRTRAPATVNRYLPILRKAFERAYHTRDPLTNARAIEEVPKIQDLPEPKRKARPIPDDVLTRLIAILPAHLVEAEKVTLFFGLRQSEVFGLQIRHVDFNMRGLWLTHDEVKDDEDAFMPGSTQAMQFMAQLVDQARDRGMKHLITWRRYRKDPEDQAREPWRPIRTPKTAWRTAMDKIEEDLGKRWRWHDLRAAFITHVAMTSGPMAAQKLGRHSDFDTTQGYIAVADEQLRAAAELASDRPALAVVKGGKS